MWNVKTKSLPQVTNDIELIITRASYREALSIPTNNVEITRVVIATRRIYVRGQGTYFDTRLFNFLTRIWKATIFGYMLWREIIQYSYTDLEINNLRWIYEQNTTKNLYKSKTDHIHHYFFRPYEDWNVVIPHFIK